MSKKFIITHYPSHAESRDSQYIVAKVYEKETDTEVGQIKLVLTNDAEDGSPVVGIDLAGVVKNVSLNPVGQSKQKK